MKVLIVILILASFLQSTVWPINLVLIILICRSFIKSDRANLFLAFAFGLLTSHLDITLFGLNSLIFLIFVQITAGLSRSNLTGNLFLIGPLTFILMVIYHFLEATFLKQSLQIFPFALWEGIISLPALLLVRLWEERFIVQREIRLKV